MHNLTTTGNLIESVKVTNDRMIDGALKSSNYSYWIPASEFEYSSGSTVFGAPTTTNPPYWIFHEGLAGYIGAYVRRNAEWRAGAFTANLHWTATDHVGAVAGWNVGLNPAPLLPAAATLPTTSLNAFLLTSVSATAMMVNRIASAGLNAASAINQKYAGLHIIVGKAASPAGDDMTSDRKLYGLELIYNQSSNQSGSYERSCDI